MTIRPFAASCARTGIRLASPRQIRIRAALLAAAFLTVFLAAWRLGWLLARTDGLGILVPQRGFYLTRWPTLAFAAALCLGALIRPRPSGRWISPVPWLGPIAIASAGAAWLMRLWQPDPLATMLTLPALAALLFVFRAEWGRALDFALSRDFARPRWGLALALLAFAAYFGLNQLMYRGRPFIGDSQARLFHALILDQGRWTLPAPDDPDLHLQDWVVVHNGRWFSQYLAGAVLLNLLGLKIGSLSLVFALLGAGAVWLAWRIGADWFDGPTAFLGAALLSISPMYVCLSSSFMEHTPATCFALAAVAAGGRHARTPSHAAAALGGLALGCVCIIRPLTAAGLLGPLAIVWSWGEWREWRRRWRFWPVAAAAWAAPVGAMLFFNWKTTGSPFVLGYRLTHPEWHSLGFTAANGFTPAEAVINQANNLTSLSLWMFMWPASSYLFIAILGICARWSAKDWLLLAPLAGLAGAYFFYPYQDFFFSPRFLAESLPFLCLLSARGALAAVRWLAGRGEAPRRRAASHCAAALLLVLFALSSKDVSIRFVNFYAVAQTGLRLDRTLESFQDKPNASVFVQDALSNTARILPHNARQAGGAVFMLAPDEARLARYRREHPDRDVYLVRPIDGGWESVPLGNPGQ